MPGVGSVNELNERRLPFCQPILPAQVGRSQRRRSCHRMDKNRLSLLFTWPGRTLGMTLMVVLVTTWKEEGVMRRSIRRAAGSMVMAGGLLALRPGSHANRLVR